MVPVAEEKGLTGGSSIDLTTCDTDGRPWVLSLPDMRRRAYLRVRNEKPKVLIGSVMCRDVCSSMNMNWPRMSERERKDADVASTLRR